MAESMSSSGERYSTWVGLIYVFNLIVGTGTLAMPKAFSEAGWLLSLVFIVTLAFMSYLTVTFTTETMAISNAKIKKNKINKDAICNSYKVAKDTEQQHLLSDEPQDTDAIEETIENSYLEITERTEMGHMASMFFNKVGLILFYVCMVVYLYGDLSIYAAAVPKSIKDIACTYQLPSTQDCNHTLSDGDQCWIGLGISRINTYRIFVTIFGILLGPFAIFNIQKTKLLQFLTTFLRWASFFTMIVLTVIRLASGKGEGHPPVAAFEGIPNLFGVCVYSFMCHHSLPSLITPIKEKSRLYFFLAINYSFVLIFYSFLSFTGIFAFNRLDAVYTLNFLPPSSCSSEDKPITDVKFIQYYLALFPVFTLSTNFPIIAVTLRNNLKMLFHREGKPYSWFVDRIGFALLAVVPPLAVALATDKVEFLVGYTGSYAGAGIQYIIPALLVHAARKEQVVTSHQLSYRHKSPFKSQLWILFVIGWAVVCIFFVTMNHIITKH